MAKRFHKQVKLVLHNLTLDDIEKYKVIFVFNYINKTLKPHRIFKPFQKFLLILLLLLLLLLLLFEKQFFKLIRFMDIISSLFIALLHLKLIGAANGMESFISHCRSLKLMY